MFDRCSLGIQQFVPSTCCCEPLYSDSQFICLECVVLGADFECFGSQDKLKSLSLNSWSCNVNSYSASVLDVIDRTMCRFLQLKVVWDKSVQTKCILADGG